MMNELVNEYFEWMCQLVAEGAPRRRRSFQKLLVYLHDVDFEYLIPMDSNRYEDGVDLRYRFGFDNDLKDAEITRYLDNRPCSVLEMLVALSMRCEENIMDNPDIGNRTGKWFWNMIDNLGLGSMTDDQFDRIYTSEIIDRFLQREYKRNGEGGLFTIHQRSDDMRKVEIWYQMMWYLDEVLGD